MESQIMLLIFLAGLLYASQASAYSLNQTEFERLVAKSCFNRSKITGQELVLGQNEPIGLSMENLISKIEKFEQLNPNLKPADVVRLFLKRFHFDGVWFNGRENVQSPTEFQHGILTTSILSNANAMPSVEPTVQNFPENQFSDDEKCNLFFSISHGVNETALEHEEESNTHLSEQYQPARAPERDLGTEVPLKTEMPTTLKAEQSEFLADSPTRSNQQRSKRALKYSKQVRLTKTPREIGVVSFLGSQNNPISVNKVLLGLLVGLSQVHPEKISKILARANVNLPSGFEDEVVDPVLAVTLGDLYGIDTDKGLTEKQTAIIFGADGEWNDTVCHTKFLLKSEGKWGTLAEFRGGIDGYNIGRLLESGTFQQIYPNITASQVLRFYYTKQGLNTQTGVCNRGYYIDGDLKDDLSKEATKYLKMWNVFHRSNQLDPEKINAYINGLQDTIFNVLKRAAILSQEETIMCTVQTTNDIRSQVCESNADAFFMLDATQRCTLGERCNQALFVNRLARQLRLGSQLGSVSVVFNAKGVDNPSVVDDQGQPIATPLYATLYNSTSAECASCRASNFDPTSKDIIRERVDLLQQIDLLIKNYDDKQQNNSAIPAKLFYWFDYGTLQPIPGDKVNKLAYERKRRELLATQRDVTFFGITKNVTNLNDIILDNQNLVTVDFNDLYPSGKIEQLASRMCQVPSVFQYNDCSIRPSKDYSNLGWITPGYKQHWAMYPDYFLKSFGITLKFRAENVLLQVCYSRNPNPEQDSKNCKTNRNVKEDVVFVVNNPCKGFTYDRCPPMYFTVSVTGEYSPKFCNDPSCQNSKQVKWYFTHSGISCNRSTTLTISLSLFVISCIISLFTSKMHF